MSGAAPAVQASGIGKSFGQARVLEGIDLTVAAGTIFAYAKWVIAILFLAGLVYTLSQ